MIDETVLSQVVDTIHAKVEAAGGAGITKREVWEAVAANMSLAEFEQTVDAMAKGNLLNRGPGAYMLYPFRTFEQLHPTAGHGDCGPLCPIHGDARDTSILGAL